MKQARRRAKGKPPKKAAPGLTAGARGKPHYLKKGSRFSAAALIFSLILRRAVAAVLEELSPSRDDMVRKPSTHNGRQSQTVGSHRSGTRSRHSAQMRFGSRAHLRPGAGLCTAG